MKTKQTLKELMKQILVNEKNQINFLETFSFHQKATGQQGYSLMPQSLHLILVAKMISKKCLMWAL